MLVHGLDLFIAIIMGVASHMNQDFTTVVMPLVTYMIIVEAITHLIDNIVFQPVIFSNSVKAHPLEIFVVVLAAGFAAGIPGNDIRDTGLYCFKGFCQGVLL